MRWLELVRRLEDKTQAQAAEKAGCHKVEWGNCERGLRPSPSLRQRILAAYPEHGDRIFDEIPSEQVPRFLEAIRAVEKVPPTSEKTRTLEDCVREGKLG
jgi:hypothetical protein